MANYTFLRVEVDSSAVERILGLTPGVEVVDEFDADTGERAPTDERERTTDRPAEVPSDDDGLVSRATPDGDLLEEESAVRKYGLLGVGISFIMLGFATVGIWWYRRRNSGEEVTEGDTEFEPPTETRTTAVTTETTAVEHERPSSPTETDETADEDDESLSIVSPTDDSDTEEDVEADTEETVETADEPAGRTDDRDDVEWTTKWEQKPRESTEEPESADADEPSPRTSESVDVAPLLGVAFIAISGAIVRWLQGDQ